MRTSSSRTPSSDHGIRSALIREEHGLRQITLNKCLGDYPLSNSVGFRCKIDTNLLVDELIQEGANQSGQGLASVLGPELDHNIGSLSPRKEDVRAIGELVGGSEYRFLTVQRRVEIDMLDIRHLSQMRV